jgi:ATP-dependent Lon protease
VTKITRLKRSGGPTIITLTLEGLCRFSIDNIVFQPQRVAKVTQLDMYDDEAAEDLVEQITNPDLVVSAEFKQAILELVSFLSAKQSVQSRLSTLISTLPLGVLCDMIASVIEASFDDKLKILNCIDITERCKICHELVNRQLVLLKMTQKIPDSISSKRGAKSNLVSETGRKLPLVTRTEPKAKRDVQQDEERINEDDDDADDTPENALEKLKQRIDSAKMPTDARRAARSEFRKVQEMEKTHNIGPEYQKAVTYLECIASLPWGISTASLSKPAIAGAKEILDRDHFGQVLSWFDVSFILIRS